MIPATDFPSRSRYLKGNIWQPIRLRWQDVDHMLRFLKEGGLQPPTNILPIPYPNTPGLWLPLPQCHPPPTTLLQASSLLQDSWGWHTEHWLDTIYDEILRPPPYPPRFQKHYTPTLSLPLIHQGLSSILQSEFHPPAGHTADCQYFLPTNSHQATPVSWTWSFWNIFLICPCENTIYTKDFDPFHYCGGWILYAGKYLNTLTYPTIALQATTFHT